MGSIETVNLTICEGSQQSPLRSQARLRRLPDVMGTKMEIDEEEGKESMMVAVYE